MLWIKRVLLGVLIVLMVAFVVVETMLATKIGLQYALAFTLDATSCKSVFCVEIRYEAYLLRNQLDKVGEAFRRIPQQQKPSRE